MSSYRTIVRHLHSPRWRSLSTSTEASSSRSPTLGPAANRQTRSKPWYPQENLRSLHPRMIFVRPWDGIPSMVHAFAIIREIESRFGKIQEFVVLRDSDVLTTNMPYMHVTFSRAESADAIPLEGKVIQVPAPKTNAERDGGVGLDDLGVYLDPVARVVALERDEAEGRKEPQWSPPGAHNVMDIKLERSGMREPPPALDIALGRKASLGNPRPPHMRNPKRAKELAEAIVAFGGFSDASPNTTGKRTRMHSLLSQWAQAVDRPPKGENLQDLQAQVEKSTTVGVNSFAAEDEIPWSPFTRGDETSTPDVEPAASSPPPQSLERTPSTPVSPSNTKRELAPTPQPAAPRLSKKQRLLLAVRSAAATQSSPNTDKQSLNDKPSLEDSSSTDGHQDGTEDQSKPSDAATPNEGNKQAARKWWNIFMGEKS